MIKPQSRQLASQFKFDLDRIDVLQLFPPHNHFKIFDLQDFASTLGKDDNHAATNFNYVITFSFILWLENDTPSKFTF
jgi:hypothetical protein